MIDHILKQSEKHLSLSPQEESIRPTRSTLNPVLEAALVNLILQMQHRHLCISDELIKEKAKTFVRMLNIPNDQCPNFSHGWLHAFKQRNRFKRYRSHGESGDADMEGIEERLKHIRMIRSRIADFDAEDEYNFDETRLFYNLAPDTTTAKR